MDTVAQGASAVAFVASAVSAYPIYRALLALKSRQTVSQFVPEHAQKQGTPTMGGLIILVGFLAACAFIYASVAQQSAGGQPQVAVPLLFVGFAMIGFVDDFVVPRLMKGKRGLGWTQKLVMQLACATVCTMLLGPSVAFGGVAMTVFLVLFFSNAYNFADGMDGLAGLLLLAMAAGYGCIASLSGVAGVVPYYGALAMAALPFLYLNKPKAKVFMGDVGALPIGAVLGLLVAITAMPSLSPASYLSTDIIPTVAQPAVCIALAVVSLMMVAELVPVPLQILSVKLRHGKRLFLMTPIHHGYQKRGWPEIRVVAMFVGFQIAFSLIGIGITRAASGVPATGEQSQVGVRQ